MSVSFSAGIDFHGEGEKIMGEKPPFVCGLCGCTVVLWRGNTWKHCANAKHPSCGKPAQPVKREEYEAYMESVKASIRRAFGTK